MSEADRNRLAACRACGNRVARDARRCPACGTREPLAAPADSPATPGVPATDRPDPITAPMPVDRPESTTAPASVEKPDTPAPPSPTEARPQAPRRASAARPTGPAVTPRPGGGEARRRRAVIAVLGLLFVLTGAGMTAVYLTMPPVASPPPSHPEAAPAPTAPAPAEPAVPGPKLASRSRGRSDWLFFFKPGDWLTRMTDDALLGVVVRLESVHTFADGSRGPAYVVQSMEGEERVVDADELERTARLR